MECEDVFIRMAENFDAPAVEDAFNPALPRLRASYGIVDFARIIETSLYSLVGLSPNDEVVAFAAFDDVPSLPGGTSGRKAIEAKTWACQEASDLGFLMESLLWLEVYASFFKTPEEEQKLLKAFLSAVFTLSSNIQVVLSLSPFEHAMLPGLLKPMSRSESMDLLLSACMSSTVLPSLRVRRALVEHHDDLLPVIKRAQMRGCPLAQVPDSAVPSCPYAVARLIAAQDNNNNVYVAEVEQELVGILAITKNVDSSLNLCFNLDIFDGLTSLEEYGSPSSRGTSALGILEDPNTLATTQEKDASFGNHMEAPKILTNAFQITMLCLEEEHENRALELFYAAFQQEEKDYCLVAFPYSSPSPRFFHHFYRVPIRTQENIAHDQYRTSDKVQLYLLHQESLAPGFEVRPVRPQDRGGVEDLLESFKDRKNILDCIDHPRKGCVMVVAASSNQVVGFAMIEDSAPTDALFSHFDVCQLVNLEQQHPSDHGTLILFVLNPLFTNRRRLFIREILQQMGKTVLYCPIFPNQELPDVIEDLTIVSGRQHSLMAPSCVWGMVPGPSSLPGKSSSRTSLRGSIQQGYPDSKAPPRRGLFFGFSCALYLTTHRLTSRHRAVVNSRIVVVGASRTAESFLHKLITCPNLRFMNLTLVSPFGFKKFSSPTSDYLNIGHSPARSFIKLGLDCHVTAVLGSVVGLDRRAHCIYLSDGRTLYYECLILSSGLQDQTRSKLEVGIEKGVVRVDELAILLDENAINFQVLDTSSETIRPVVVYGLSLESFFALELLLSKGLKGNSLSLVYPEVEPLESLAVQCFGDSSIANLVIEELQEAGIIVKSGLKLLGSILNDTEQVLQSLIFEISKELKADTCVPLNFERKGESTDQLIQVQQPCRLLVTCDKRLIDLPLFRAIKKEGLVFDGRVVVDGNFQTNDDCIFAVGSLCKFSRRCGKQPKLENFNSDEMGSALADSIISLFAHYLPSRDTLVGSLLPLPSEEPPQVNLTGKWPRTSIPRLTHPKGIGGLLPGGFCYFSITSPIFMQTLEAGTTSLVSQKGKCIFRMDVTDTREVWRITYYGKENLEAWKMAQIVGLPEVMLNNLVTLYSEGQVVNVLKFFSHPWFTAIFHDKFMKFYHQICITILEMLKNAPQEQQMINDLLREKFLMFMNLYKTEFQGLHLPASKNHHAGQIYWKKMRKFIKSGSIHQGKQDKLGRGDMKKFQEKAADNELSVENIQTERTEKNSNTDMAVSQNIVRNSASREGKETVETQTELRTRQGLDRDMIKNLMEELTKVLEIKMQIFKSPDMEISAVVDEVVKKLEESSKFNLDQLVKGKQHVKVRIWQEVNRRGLTVELLVEGGQSESKLGKPVEIHLVEGEEFENENIVIVRLLVDEAWSEAV